MDKTNIKQAYSEINVIIRIMPKNLSEKIPIKFKKMIEEERDINYVPVINTPIKKDKLKKETLTILALIYRDFVCEGEERKRLQIKDAKEVKRIEDERLKKFSKTNLFKREKKKNIDVENSKETQALIPVKETWFIKIIQSIKRFFNKM